jgi:tRNA-dihydrouridine synthase B
MTWYAKGFPGAADLRGKLCLVENVQQGLDLIDAAIDSLPHANTSSITREDYSAALT